MCGRLDFYLNAFATLKDDCLATLPERSLLPDCLWCPLLMITVVDAIDSGMLKRNYIEPSEELEHTYKSYNLIHDDKIMQQPSMAVPFWHLQYTDLWELRWRQPQPPDIHITDIGQLRKHVYGAVLSQELFPLLLMPQSREKLKRSLILSYLPDLLST